MNEKQMIEKEIFEKLRSVCRPHSTPIPHKIFDQSITKSNFLEVAGIFSLILSYCFTEMTETDGESQWEIECKQFINRKQGKDRLTKNKLTKILVSCLDLGWIEYIKDPQDSIHIKINASYLYPDLKQ